MRSMFVAGMFIMLGIGLAREGLKVPYHEFGKISA